MTTWTTADIPSQRGRTALVTGANSGLGYETALALARSGAQVVMACRSPQRSQAALQSIRSQAPEAAVELLALDLGSLAGVRAAAQEFQQRFGRLDLLINNAGMMAPPYGRTADGFETQFGINHLGHFALTGLLLPTLLATPGSRVVTVSSMAARGGQINFADLQSDKSYSRYGAYSQSKLANLLFAFELGRRLAAAGRETLSLAAHPGLARTDLQVRAGKAGSALERAFYRPLMGILAQSQAAGALPLLYAAIASPVDPAVCYAPSLRELRGTPKAWCAPAAAYDLETARRLWEVSEELTSVVYNPLLA